MRANLSRLIDQAVTGEEVVITRRGRPVVRLVPVRPAVEQPGRRRLGTLAGTMDIPDEALFEPLPEEFLREFDGDSVEASDDADDRNEA
jgi:prevent-host-death family protein